MDIQVITRNATSTACPAGWKPVFSREWAGTFDGCLINKNSTVIDVTSLALLNLVNKTNCDVPIAKNNSVIMDNFYGVTICGLLGGDPFRNATRIDPKTGKCPVGTSPCSSLTSLENTICYAPNLLATKCPITDLIFTNNVTLATVLRGKGYK